MEPSAPTSDRPSRLFRFFDSSGAQFLENRLLWFRPVGDQNDPFDGVPATGAMVRTTKSAWLKRMLWDGVLTNETYADFEERHKKSEDDVHENFLKGTRGQFAIVCFTESLDRIPFWSFYAEKHKGFAVEFDPRHKFFDRLVSVIYTDHRPPAVRQVNESRGFDLLRTKSKDWADENEWRLPAMLQNLKRGDGPKGTGFTHYLKVPEDAFRAVIFGCRAEPTLKNRIGKFLKCGGLSKIECLEMKPDLDRYKRNVVPATF